MHGVANNAVAPLPGEAFARKQGESTHALPYVRHRRRWSLPTSSRYLLDGNFDWCRPTSCRCAAPSSTPLATTLHTPSPPTGNSFEQELRETTHPLGPILRGIAATGHRIQLSTIPLFVRKTAAVPEA